MTATYTGINAAFRESATQAEIKEAALMRHIDRQSIRRLAIDQGRARVGDYVKGIQYGYANGRFLKDVHVVAEGRVVERLGERLTIERGDGARFSILASDKYTRAFSWKTPHRYTADRKAKADAIRARRNQG